MPKAFATHYSAGESHLRRRRSQRITGVGESHLRRRRSQRITVRANRIYAEGVRNALRSGRIAFTPKAFTTHYGVAESHLRRRRSQRITVRANRIYAEGVRNAITVWPNRIYAEGVRKSQPGVASTPG